MSYDVQINEAVTDATPNSEDESKFSTGPSASYWFFKLQSSTWLIEWMHKQMTGDIIVVSDRGQRIRDS